MERYSSKKPWTVPDELAEPYEQMAQWQRQKNAAQEAQLMRKASAPTKREETLAAKREKTAKQASKVATVAEVGAGLGTVVTRHQDDIDAFRAFKRFTGPIGKGFDARAAEEGFRADLASGVPWDEAAIKHFGGFAASLGLGALGGTAGTAVGGALGSALPGPGTVAGGLAGGAAGGAIGQELGGHVGEGAAKGWRKVKSGAREFKYRTLPDIGRLNQPQTYLNMRRRGTGF